METHDLNRLIEETRDKGLSLDRNEFLSWSLETIPKGLEGLEVLHDYVRAINPKALWSLDDWKDSVLGEQEDWVFIKEPVDEHKRNILEDNNCVVVWSMGSMCSLKLNISPKGSRWARWEANWLPGSFFQMNESLFCFWEEGDETMGRNRRVLWDALQTLNDLSQGQLFWDINHKLKTKGENDSFPAWWDLVNGDTVDCPDHRDSHDCFRCCNRGVISKHKMEKMNWKSQSP